MGAQPDWSSLMEVINDFRREMNERLDKLATKEALSNEIKRTAAAIRQVDQRVTDHEKETEELARARAATRSKWFYGIFFAVLAAALTAAGTLTVALIEAQQHLTGVVKP